MRRHPKQSSIFRKKSIPLKIVLIYAIIGGLWVLLSDKFILTLFDDPATREMVGIYKGWFFVLVTALLLFVLIDRYWINIKATEQRLRENQRFLSTLMNNLPGLVYRCRNDENWTMEFVSKGSFQLTGYQPDEILNNKKTSYNQLIHPDYREKLRNDVQTALKTGRSFQVQYPIIDATNAEKWVWEQGCGIYSDNDELLGIEGFIADITELKKAEEDRINLAAIVESSDDAIIAKSLDGEITNWNAGAEKIYGYTANEAIGKDISILFPPDRPGEVTQLLEKLKSGERIDHFETVRQRKDGQQIHVSLTLSPVKDTEGNIVSASTIARDITERKKAEEQARLHQQQLLQADKMASLGILVSGVAHEINNPNNLILLNASILREVWGDLLPILKNHYESNGDFSVGGLPYLNSRDKIGKLFSGITDGADRIQKIVESLKDFARQDTGDLNQQIDINKMIESAIVIAHNLIKKSTHCFSVEYGEKLPLVKGNYQQLEQVVINLLTNACQALVSMDNKITLSTTKKFENVIIKVFDEGTGIPKENLKRVFDPFFTTKRATGGTGLGLSISYNIIKDHNGELAFESKPGKGTTATVKLPVSKDGKKDSVII